MSAEGLGRYEIVEELGRGAMGVVYLAQDPALGRLVAVKALDGPPRNGDSASFLREARAAGGLDHPGIVTVHDATDGERPFIAMEYVQGTDLKELLRPGQPLPHDFVLKVTEQIAAALDYAHSKGVVHRDIKPGNILITTHETVKLTDFGIASAPSVAEPTERLGTPHYVAPEQLHGDAVDRRADVFALGVVVYEMLTGKLPFDHPDLKEVVRQLAHEPFTPPTEHGVTLPAAVIKVLRRALAKSPADRLATAGDLARALRAAFEGREEAATRDLSDLLPEPPPPPPRRRRPLLWATVCLAVLLATASGWGLAQKTFLPRPAEAPQAPHFDVSTPDTELRREAEGLLAAGDAMTAARLLDLAVQMAPHRPELRRLRGEAEIQAEAQRAAMWRDGTVERLLLEAQQARGQGRYSQAIAALRQAAELDPEQPVVRDLLERLEAARARYLASRQRAEPEPQVTPVTPEFVPPPAPAPVEAAPQPLPDWSDLRVDLYSQVPRGVVTVYAGGEQVMNQPFRFGKRSGLLRRKSGAGRLEAKRRLPAGDTELRVYVTLPGRAATRRTLDVSLPPGASRVLRILIDPAGEPSVQLD